MCSCEQHEEHCVRRPAASLLDIHESGPIMIMVQCEPITAQNRKGQGGLESVERASDLSRHGCVWFLFLFVLSAVHDQLFQNIFQRCIWLAGAFDCHKSLPLAVVSLEQFECLAHRKRATAVPPRSLERLKIRAKKHVLLGFRVSWPKSLLQPGAIIKHLGLDVCSEDG
jgi:hypothetical protein